MLNRRKAKMQKRTSENNARMVRFGREAIEIGEPFEVVVETVCEQTSLSREDVVRELSSAQPPAP